MNRRHALKEHRLFVITTTAFFHDFLSLHQLYFSFINRYRQRIRERLFIKPTFSLTICHYSEADNLKSNSNERSATSSDGESYQQLQQ